MDDRDELLEDPPKLGLIYLTQIKMLLMNMQSPKMRMSNSHRACGSRGMAMVLIASPPRKPLRGELV